jgi:prevent-host-death family protein
LTLARLLASLKIMQAGNAISLGTFEAKNKFSSLVELASKGSRIWITKRGRRVALLSSGVEGGAKTDADLVAAFRKIRGRSKPGKGSLKSLIEEGRR